MHEPPRVGQSFVSLRGTSHLGVQQQQQGLGQQNDQGREGCSAVEGNDGSSSSDVLAGSHEGSGCTVLCMSMGAFQVSSSCVFFALHALCLD